MADVPVGAVPSPEPAKAVTGLSGAVAAQSARAAKLATVSAGLKKLAAEEGPPVAASSEAPLLTPSEPATQPPASVETAEEPKLDAKPADDKPDPKTQKGLDAVEKAAKKFRDEQAAERKAWKAEIEQERAEIARLKADAKADTGKYTSLDELTKIASTDPLAALAKLGYKVDDEDAAERIARGAFAFTKAGKANPQNRENVQSRSELASLKAELAETRKALDEVKNEFTTRDKKAEAAAFVDRFANETLKAIPTEPTLIGKLHAKSPQKARQALLEVAARLERENDNETPAHADVIAEYERVRRAELEEQGVDVDALLRPQAARPAAAAPSKTLDVATPNNGTRPINGNPTRAEKLAKVSAGLQKLHAEQP